MRQRKRTSGEPPAKRPDRWRGPVRRGAAAGGALALALTAGADRGETYRLLDNGASDFVVGSESAIRWAPGVWGPGATLAWQVADSPEWARLFGSRREFESAVGEALSRWSNLETADIRWSVSGTPGAAISTWTRDSSSQVFFHSSGAEWENGAGLWFERDPSGREWQITECDVGAPRFWIDQFGGLDPATAAGIAVEELGNSFARCLGLEVSAEMPYSATLRPFDTDDLSSSEFHLTPWESREDRRIGASLLRPRAGWLSTVGSIAGTLVSDGEPVSYAHVWAFRTNGAGDVRDPVGAFTDRSGAFSIEGLAPGDYALWAHPVSARSHGLRLLEATIGVRDAILAHPVGVTAGGVAHGIRIPMRRGR